MIDVIPFLPKLENTKPMHPNEIGAMYMQMVNSGMNGITQLSGPMISLEEWRDRMISRWQASQ